jgi:hypothetical protein
MKKNYKSGETAEHSGQYLEIGPRGCEKKEVTVVKGKNFPPTETPHSHFILVDKTKNKSGR